jgi:cysteine desulfurase
MSVMLVNNETGSLIDASDWHFASGVLDVSGRGARHFHCDLTQAAGKMPLHDQGYDLGTLSAHKFYGPTGVGALHMRGVTFDEPWVMGGSQENGLRGGTLNVAGIVGMGAAAALALDAMEEEWQRAQEMRLAVIEELHGLSDWLVIGREEMDFQNPGQSPYILCLAFAQIEGESLVVELDSKGYGASSGAACSVGSTEPSHVLTALKVPEDLLRGALRVSFGRFNTLDSARNLGRLVKSCVESLRQFGS